NCGSVANPEECALSEKRTGARFGVAHVNGAICNSSCAMVVAGGIRRLVGPAQVGVHQLKRSAAKGTSRGEKNSSSSLTNLPKRVFTDYRAYLKEMGIREVLKELAQSPPPDQILIFGLDQMLALNLPPARDSAIVLTTADQCAAKPPADDCVEFPGATGE